MRKITADELVKKLEADPEFLRKFAEDPGNACKAAGITFPDKEGEKFTEEFKKRVEGSTKLQTIKNKKCWFQDGKGGCLWGDNPLLGK
jgi:hypothetical protein